jgi:sugar phosphate isomerase/epimerase
MPWDIFFSRAKRDVLIQYDIGNAAHTGADARTYLKKYPGRVASVHVKPFSKANPNALIGDDELPWPDIFKLCENVSGVKWYIVEYERENEPALVSVEKLRKILCGMGKC